MRLLVVSQVYVPDPAAVGQHMASAAEALVARGADVTVLTADRGYDDPSLRYPRSETRGGVRVRRLPFSSLGKRSLPVRLAGMLCFLCQACLRALFVPRLDAILVSTSPPMAGVLLAAVARVRRVPLAFWAMDLNPEQAVALGKARPGGAGARVFGWSNRFLQATAARVIVLDRFMAAKLEARGPQRPATKIIPPWPLESERLGRADGLAFRRAQGLEGKFVVMHSGNHSLAHPLATLIDAARALRDDERIRFVFVGGGVGKREVEAAVREGLPNVVSLPYQPLGKLADTLAAADVQVVAMGDAMVGCVHPCKVYGALAAARPVLYLGPAESHVGEIVASGAGWRVAHGDVPEMLRVLREAAGRPARELTELGAANRRLVEERFDAERLRGEFCAFVEEMAEGAGRRRGRKA
jgi:glycosyltransferase involved in cell wall biosynthesis